MPGFVTWKGGSRRSLSARWVVPQRAVYTAPVSAWIVRPRPARKPLKRKLQVVPQLKWQYIAPTMAPLLGMRKVARIEFRQKIRVASPLVLSTPPTGPPPYSAWVARPVKRVAWNRKLIRVADLETYPQTQVVVSADRATAVPFTTRKTRSRKVQKVAITPIASVATPGTSPAVLAAFTKPVVRKRKSAGSGFVAVSVLFGGTTAAVAVSPAALVRAQSIRRRKTDRKLLRAPTAKVFPATPAVPTQSPAAYAAKKAIKRRETERVLRVARIAPVYPAPAPAVPPIAAWFVVKTNRTSQKRKLLGVKPVYARIAAAAFSLAAIDRKTVYRRHTKPRKAWHFIGYEHVEPGLQAGGWIVYPGSHRTVNPSGNRTVRPSR